MEATYHAIKTRRKAQKGPSRVHFTWLEVCCYDIDPGATNQRRVTLEYLDDKLVFPCAVEC